MQDLSLLASCDASFSSLITFVWPLPLRMLLTALMFAVIEVMEVG